MIKGQVLADQSRPQSRRGSSPATQQGYLSSVILRAAPSFIILNLLSSGYLALLMMNNGVFLVTNVSV